MAALVLVVHWTTAWAVSRSSILVVFVAAFVIGQLVVHLTVLLSHESAHRLVFKDRRLKLAFDLLLEATAASFSRQLTYQYNHLASHHPYLGDYEGDYEHEDLCRFSARHTYRSRHPIRMRMLTGIQLVMGLVPYGFLFESIVVSRFLARATRVARRDASRTRELPKPPAAERLLLVGVSIAVHILMFVCFGVLGWLYHVWSTSLFLSRLNIFGIGQVLSEHPGDDAEMPTRSTYWWGNRVLLNTGYHFEHHTFPNVPWSRLPRLTKAAPEVFNATVANSRSYFRFWWDHLKQDFDVPIRRSAVELATDASRTPAPIAATPSAETALRTAA